VIFGAFDNPDDSKKHLTYKIKCIKNTRRNTNEFNQPNRTKKTNKIRGIYLA
jgi:hypothetical protein